MTLFFAGDIDHRSTDMLVEKIESLDLGTVEQLYANFSNTSHIDRNCLGLMLVLLKRCNDSDTDIALVDCPEEVIKLLEYCRFDKLFEILESNKHAENKSKRKGKSP